MSKKFMIFVIDDSNGTATQGEMSAIDAFNDQLKANGQWIFAWGLHGSEAAMVIDNRGGADISSDGSLFNGEENFSGFWLIETADKVTAQKLAFEASKACNRKVEFRPLHG